jgi:membrane protease subunit HflC
MKAGVEQSLFDDFGIRVVEVGVRRISLPREVTQEVFKSMTEDRKRYAARFREEGKSRADAIKARAESDAKQILAFADRKAQEIRSAGIQASTRILGQIESSDREFFEWLRWLETIKSSLAQRTTIFIDKDWPLFKPFVEAPTAGAPATPTPAPAAQDGGTKEQP